MKTSTTIGIIVLVVVLVGAWMLFSPSKSVVAPTPQPNSDTSENGNGTFVQQAPSTSPLTGEEESGVLGSPVPDGASQQMATVQITDTGFSPATLTVKAGTKVTFVNNGQGAHWPASDPHPTHTGLPGFDARTGLTTGDSYSFVFDKVGTWGYHDHLHASTRGTIIVQ